MNGLSTIVVGGSLAGLTAAVALDRAGVKTDVVEKKSRMPATTGGLGVETFSRNDSPTARHIKSLFLDEDEEALASYGHVGKRWTDIYESLLSELEKSPRATLHFDQRATAVGQEENSASVTTDAGPLEADFVIGADGHRSIVRGAVDPNKPHATFAGYVNWLGTVPEADLPAAAQNAHVVPTQEYVLQQPGKIMIGFVQPGLDGSVAPGERDVMFAQYDARSNHIARRIGAVVDDRVMFTIHGEDLTEEEVATLIQRTKDLPWPEPFQSAMLLGLRRREFKGIVLKEYVPDRLANGRLAIVGDAAHVATSWTGMGYNASLHDAATLAELIIEHSPTAEEIPDILQQYERRRLNKVRRIVQSGQRFSRSFREEY